MLSETFCLPEIQRGLILKATEIITALIWRTAIYPELMRQHFWHDCAT